MEIDMSISRNKKKKLLVVGEDESRLDNLSNLLTGEGFKVNTAPLRKELYPKILDTKPGVIIVDGTSQSRKAGFVCRMIRQKGRARKIKLIVLLSGKGAASEIERICKAGADHCLLSPVSARLIVKHIA